MGKSKIEWLNDGSVWNPVTGCTKVSEGCRNCYAESMAKRFWKDRKFTDIVMHTDRLDLPMRWRKPQVIFVNSVSDLFHEQVPFDFVDRVFLEMSNASLHTFIILTKRPERMNEYVLSWTLDGGWYRRGNSDIWLTKYPYSNVWLGVSVEDQKTADKRIPYLLKTNAVKRIVSVEPLIGEVDLKDYIQSGTGLDWVIVGGESGANARPMKVEWVRTLCSQCEEANIPFFFKSWGEWLPAGQRSVYPSDYLPKAVKYHDFGDSKSARIGRSKTGYYLDGIQYRQYP